MNIQLDQDRYDTFQTRLLEEIIRSIVAGLKEAKIEDETTISEAAEIIGFSVASILDGSRTMEAEGRPCVPFLTFANEPGGIELLAAEGGSWMHEYVFNTVLDVLGEQDADDDPD